MVLTPGSKIVFLAVDWTAVSGVNSNCEIIDNPASNRVLDTQYTTVVSMQYGVVARCVVYCIDVFGVGGIDDFGVRALLCVCVLFIGGVLRVVSCHAPLSHEGRMRRFFLFFFFGNG